MPAIAAALATLVIALPWPIFVLSQMSGQLSSWYRQMTQGGNTASQGANPPWVYLSIFPLMLPWVGFFILGLVLLIRDRTDRGILIVLLLVTPIIIMCFFSEKNDRYLLPMLAPAALISATGFVRRGNELDVAHRITAGITWGILAAIALGLPIAGLFLERVDGGPWWSKSLAILFSTACLGCVALAWVFDRDDRRALVPAGAAIMLAAQAIFIFGYSTSPRGRSNGRPLAEAVWAALPPDAEIWSYTVPGRFGRVPVDMQIYLNRIVRPASSPTTLPSTSQARVMLVHFRGDEKLPEGLEQWKVVGETAKNEGSWRAYAEPRAKTKLMPTSRAEGSSTLFLTRALCYSQSDNRSCSK
jgi:hypothetical protein